MNSPKIHWQKFTSLLAVRVTNQSLTRLTDESRENILIVDDTLQIAKNAGGDHDSCFQ
ncbi:hypothetical protein [Acetobacterium carbinolicum]|uniref:hypothetical protein n=1 Tax=Acetobacterium carbinolicum TaxID=52690 RepID=UPI003BF594DC